MNQPLPEPSAPADMERTERAPEYVEPRSGLRDVQKQIGDFVLVRELGRGGFARVFLAHQVSLDRRVALKLTRQPTGPEAQTLGKLEHDHIVKVYSEITDPISNHHGLVLQYIPGTSLAEVLAVVFRDGRPPSQGAEVLQAIDLLARDDVDFDPASLRDRDVLARSDYLTSVCRLGARMAEALAFAHANGILHCDVKPANILLNRYGRPLLADFNVAVKSRVEGEPHPMGGTLLYMAPEQLAAFAHLPGGDAKDVDHRADLYSLGLVLLEMVIGRVPHQKPPSADQAGQVLFDFKKQIPEDWLPEGIPIPTVLWRILRRCLQPDKEERFANGTQLAKALQHAADLLEARHNMPPESRLARLTRRRPIAVLLTLALLPNLIGSVVNIAYNTSQIQLTPEQERVFMWVVLGYNMLIYPLLMFIGWRILLPLVHILGKRGNPAALPAAQIDSLRRRALSLGNWAIALSLVGWLPGGLLFPLIIDLATGPPGWPIYGHYLVSFTLSGLIALVYSYFGAQWVVLRGMYLRLVHAEVEPQQVKAELDASVAWVGFFQCLAALVPLTGAILLLALGPGEMSVLFRLLVVALIVAGMVGLGIAVWVSQSLRQLVAILQGPGARPKGGSAATAYYG